MNSVKRACRWILRRLRLTKHIPATPSYDPVFIWINDKLCADSLYESLKVGPLRCKVDGITGAVTHSHRDGMLHIREVPCSIIPHFVDWVDVSKTGETFKIAFVFGNSGKQFSVSDAKMHKYTVRAGAGRITTVDVWFSFRAIGGFTEFVATNKDIK